MMSKLEIERYLQEVIAEVRDVGIPVATIIDSQVTINKRAKSRFASCKSVNDALEARFTIEVSETLLQCTPNSLKEILVHEVLHTCPGCQNHGYPWKIYAEKVNTVYGYKITRTTSYEALGIEKPETYISINYIITCRRCGKVFERQRRSKIVTHTAQYRCQCGGELICEKKDQS